MTSTDYRCAFVVTLVALTFGCAVPDGTNKTKKLLSKHGSIDAEWTIRDDASKKTYTYVLLRNKNNTHSTYELTTSDAKREVTRELAGGIDATGCFLQPHGATTPWIQQRPPEILQNARQSGERTRTACLEYKDTPGWQFIPEADRKAAEPPPPEPTPPAEAPDAGTPDAEAPTSPTSGEVKSVPL